VVGVARKNLWENTGSGRRVLETYGCRSDQLLGNGMRVLQVLVFITEKNESRKEYEFPVA
jgi:hypothetical protein